MTVPLPAENANWTAWGQWIDAQVRDLRGRVSSLEGSVPTAPTITAPSQVTGLTPGVATQTTQPLTWSAPASNGSAITDYVVQYKRAVDNTWTTFPDGTSTSLAATVTGLTAGTSYDYRVVAVNAVGAGPASATITRSTAATTPVTPPTPTTRPYLTAADWLWNPIPANPVLDTQSAAMAATLAGAGDKVVAMRAFGVTIVDAGDINAQTPRYLINFTAGWGNPFGSTQMPIPNGTVVPGIGDPNYDGHVSVADPQTGKVFNLWRANFASATKSASYGAMVDLAGDGRETNGSSTGAGLARLAGVIRVEEMAAGRIPHALFFSTNRALGPNGSQNFRYPATKTDGNKLPASYPGEALIPEGARIQLDPSINVDALSIPAGAKIIAKALQEFGAYCGDNGGARMGFIAEHEVGTSPGPTYRSLGLTNDYAALNLPWSSVRVLRNWHGA